MTTAQISSRYGDVNAKTPACDVHAEPARHRDDGRDDDNQQAEQIHGAHPRRRDGWRQWWL